MRVMHCWKREVGGVGVFVFATGRPTDETEPVELACSGMFALIRAAVEGVRRFMQSQLQLKHLLLLVIAYDDSCVAGQGLTG